MTRSALLLMVPGAYFNPHDFVDHGFLAALQRHAPEVQPAVANLPPERYLHGDEADWLHAEIVAPAQARSTRPVWILGVSLGAMGALSYARAHPAGVAGIILLAPFLGTRGLIAEVLAAGGLGGWNPGPVAHNDRERRLMTWLQTSLPARLHLGYGTADRYVTASRLLAERLPERRVCTTEGGHDWQTWERLWDMILQQAPFDDGEIACAR